MVVFLDFVKCSVGKDLLSLPNRIGRFAKKKKIIIVYKIETFRPTVLYLQQFHFNQCNK